MKKRTHGGRVGRTLLVGLLLAGLAPTVALAMPPAPLNDDPNNAEVISGPLPAVIYGTSVLADNSITSLPALPAIDAYVDGPDVYYSFTPATTATYRIELFPWQHAPLRSSDRRFVIYVLDDTMTAVDGVRAPGDARPVNLDVALTSGTTYLIGIDHDDTTYDNFEFTLILDQLNLTNPDDPNTVETLSGPLPLARLNNIDGAVNDFAFVQGTGRCGVSGTPTTAPGNDHVYKFTAPADGDYAMELVGNLFDAVLYVNDSCPPVFPGGCLGASNHSTSGSSGGKHELVVVTLQAGVDYYIYVDNGSTTNLTGQYALVIDDAFNYEINEIEYNDTPATATPVTTPLNGGQLVGPTDVDYWSITGLTGDRVYAWVNNGGSSNSTLDTNLAFLAADGLTLIEYDDEDGDGADAPINDWRYVYSTDSPVIAGARLTSDGAHYFEVSDSSATGTVSRYRFHVGLIPGTRVPLAECEPNEDIDSADYSGKHYYSGAIVSGTDHDFYAFYANVGDRVFVALDGDPERDSTGFDSANTDPLAFHAKLVIYDPFGDILISDISDSNTITSGPDYPAQGGYFVARTAGWHYVDVGPQSTSSQTGPTETYELAIFLNDAAPALAEDVDPLVSLTPDYSNDVIAAVATDNQPGDTGICDVQLHANNNLQITNLSTLPAASATFDIELVDPNINGTAKLVVVDCAGNTSCQWVTVDVSAPLCGGENLVHRVVSYLGDPIWVPDNDLNGVQIPLPIGEAGFVADVNVFGTFETTSVSDFDIYLISPTGTTVEVQTDRGSSSAFNMTDVVWDDSAASTMPLLSSDEPYTGTWLPEGVLATFNGEQAQGTWYLKVVDDSSSASGGSRVVQCGIDVLASLPGPEFFNGSVTDEDGISSIILSGATNVQLNLPSFTPGDMAVEYTVTLIDPTQSGSGTITVTDLQENACVSPISLNGLPDNDAPANTGGVTTDVTFKQEVQGDIPSSDQIGVTSTIIVPDAFLVGEVEVDITIDTRDLGRLAATLTKGAQFTALLNRTGMTERQSVGLTKDTIWVQLDDDAPQADDAHLEPALGTIPFQGLHQPDGRGDFVGDGISTDPRDNMLFRIANQTSVGGWKAQVADYRLQSTTRSEWRRWALTLKSPCGPERYAGVVEDAIPGTGIQSIARAGGATNLVVVADFVPGAEKVEYRVELIDPTQPGSGTLEITDGAGNVTPVAISLQGEGADQNPPLLSGDLNLANHRFEGGATDNQAGDSGIAAVEIAPFGDNIQLLSVSPNPPNGAASVNFVVEVVDPNLNGRGYVRVTDMCGWRSYILVEIDATNPVCTGAVEKTKRYISTDLPQPIPDNDTAGVTSSILVPDTGLIKDVNVTFNITHGFDDDIDMTLTSPIPIALMNDIGSTGNDFIDTTLDDEAAAPIPDSSTAAPFTGSFQPVGGPALFALDNVPANATYSLKVVDDKTYDYGTFDSWSLTIDSGSFPDRYDGRAEDGVPLDTGICSFSLIASENVSLVVDPFTPGDKIVRFALELTDPQKSGAGRARVYDCVGNYREVSAKLVGLLQLGDMNCDGAIDFGDINPFVLALVQPAEYPVQYPACDIMHADINNSGAVGFDDINPFVALLIQ